MKPTFAGPTLWMTFFYRQLKKRDTSLTPLPIVVLALDGADTLWGSLQCAENGFYVLKLCMPVSTHIHMYTMQWRLPQTPQALERLTLPCNKPRTHHELPNFMYIPTPHHAKQGVERQSTKATNLSGYLPCSEIQGHKACRMCDTNSKEQPIWSGTLHIAKHHPSVLLVILPLTTSWWCSKALTKDIPAASAAWLHVAIAASLFHTSGA